MKLSEEVLARHIRPLSPIPTGEIPVLDRLRPFRAILFDVYGTLLISAAGEIAADETETANDGDLGRLFARYGVSTPGRKVVEALRQAIREAHAQARRKGIDCPEVDILKIWRQVLRPHKPSAIEALALEYELIVNPVFAMPGAVDLLAACRTARIPMGIISNAQCYTAPLIEWLFEASLEALGFDRRLLFFSWLELYAKPSPVMFQRGRAALSTMGIPASAAIFVGNDMRNDVWPASQAGFQTALFVGDGRSLRRRSAEPCCRALTPDVVITDLRQLTAGIDQDGAW